MKNERGSPTIEVAGVGTETRTLALSAGQRLNWQDFSARLGFEGCPPFDNVAEPFALGVPDTLVLGSRSFACTKLTTRGTRDGGVRQHASVWVTPAKLSFPRILAAELDGERVVTLVACGRDGAVEFGKRPDVLPFHPIGNAQQSFWAAVSYKTQEKGWTTLYELESIHGDEAVINERTHYWSGERDSRQRIVSMAAPPLVGFYLPGVAVDVASVTSTDVTETVGGRAFRCVEFGATGLAGDGSERRRAAIAVHVSPDVFIMGLVSARVEADSTVLFSAEVVGWGTGSRTIWGEKPDW